MFSENLVNSSHFFGKKKLHVYLFRASNCNMACYNWTSCYQELYNYYYCFVSKIDKTEDKEKSVVKTIRHTSLHVVQSFSYNLLTLHNI